MKKLLLVGIVLLTALSLMNCASAGGLPQFGADLGKQSNPVPGMDDIRVPYTSMVSYYGYVKPGEAPDEVVGGKKMYYLYVWVPLVAPEMGVRMVSPVPDGMTPTEKDFVAPTWAEGSKDKTNYFDTWVSFERSAEVINPEDIAKAKTGTWLKFDANDDSSELPAQPSGNKYNSVLRMTSEPSNPLKALIRGLYRIGFTTYKVGEVQGTFLAQVGAPIELPGVQITKTLDDMIKVAK